MTNLEALESLENEYGLPYFDGAKDVLRSIWSLEIGLAKSNIEDYEPTASWITYRVKEIVKNANRN